MYALDPWSDPHGALLHLDYLSIKAGMTQWLIDLWEVFEPDVEKEMKEGKSPYVRRIIPNIMPGIVYSHALALFIREEGSGDVVSADVTSVSGFAETVMCDRNMSAVRRR